MRFRNAGIIISFFVAIMALCPGCKKSPDKEAAAKSPPTPSTNQSPPQMAVTANVSRIHWNGISRLAADTNAVTFLKFWNQPDTVKLLSHTLDKLSRAPWAADTTNTNANTNAATNVPAAALLRPLLDDLVQEESFLEVSLPTNAGAGLVFAIRLNEVKATLWQTNFAAVVEILTGAHVNSAGPQKGRWHLNLDPGKNHSVAQVDFAPVGEWTLIGCAVQTNNLFEEFLGQVQKDWIPYSRAPKYWLEADLNLPAIEQAFALNWQLPGNFPTFNLTILGEGGENVLTRAEFDFRKPPLGPLSPWIIPTNLVTQPLLGFTAIRGIAPLLESSDLLSSVKPVPDQLYIWDRPGPFHLFFALPVGNAMNALTSIGGKLIALANPKIPEKKYGSLSLETNALNWNGLPHATPFLEARTNSTPELLFGGFGPIISVRANPMPPEIITHLNETTNLVFFDWENTADRIVHWRYLDDVYRIVFDLHGPRLSWTPSMNWFENSMTNLSFSVSEVKQLDANRLSFARRSTLGLSGLELDLLANWIELPQFPRGLTSIMATNPTPVIRRTRPNPAQTNSPPPPPGP